MNMGKGIGLLLAVLVPTCAALAQQQSPSQHSPTQHKYKPFAPEPESKRDKEAARTRVKLRWKPMKSATEYVVRIALDSGMRNTLVVEKSKTNWLETSPLDPGVYYYQVEGRHNRKGVGKHFTDRFVVGKPLTVTSREKPLAPAILGPQNMKMFPTYGKVRMAWQRVPEARGYRFRLWEEEKFRENQRWKREAAPRWVTEVKEPWIVVHDAPYTSYMYLDSGVYRWDVAAVSKDGGYIGDPSQGFFRVSRQFFLRESELFIRAGYGFASLVSYSEVSNVTQTKYELTSPSHAFNAELDWWIGRQWGMGFSGGFQTYEIKVPSNTLGTRSGDTTTVGHFGLDALFRTYLSTRPDGWSFTALAGLGMQEYPLIGIFKTDPEQVHFPKPQGFGPRLGFGFLRRWASPWELQFLARTLIPVVVFHDTSDSADVVGTPNGEFTLRTLYHWTPHFALAFGGVAQIRRGSDVGLHLSAQFNYW